MDTAESKFTTAISDQDEEPDDSDPSRFCGRYLQTNAGAFATVGTSMCSKYWNDVRVSFEFSYEYLNGTKIFKYSNYIYLLFM